MQALTEYKVKDINEHYPSDSGPFAHLLQVCTNQLLDVQWVANAWGAGLPW